MIISVSSDCKNGLRSVASILLVGEEAVVSFMVVTVAALTVTVVTVKGVTTSVVKKYL